METIKAENVFHHSTHCLFLQYTKIQIIQAKLEQVPSGMEGTCGDVFSSVLSSLSILLECIMGLILLLKVQLV